MRPITMRLALAKFRDENLVSRAQAKLIAHEIEKDRDAQAVHQDFSGIREIGQGFADELFRVFAIGHPDIDLHPTNCNLTILAMIGGAVRTAR